MKRFCHFMQPDAYKRIGLVLAGVLLSMAIAALLFPSPARIRAHQQQELEAAYKRWQAHNLVHYQFRLEHEHMNGLPIPPPCYQDVHVQHGAVMYAEQSDICTTSPLTVEELFAEAETFLHNPLDMVNINGPGVCFMRSTVTLTFHADLGYPLLVEHHSTLHTNWLHLDTWRIWLNTGNPPACDLLWVNGSLIRYRVLELTPVP